TRALVRGRGRLPRRRRSRRTRRARSSIVPRALESSSRLRLFRKKRAPQLTSEVEKRHDGLEPLRRRHPFSGGQLRSVDGRRKEIEHSVLPRLLDERPHREEAYTSSSVGARVRPIARFGTCFRQILRAALALREGWLRRRAD